jgi:Zn-dependent M32 family carboxypeptidase
MMELTNDKIVQDLLFPIWYSSADWVKKDWSIFQNNVRDALSKRTLSQFFSHICRRCNTSITYKYLIERIEPVLKSGKDEQILKMLDDDLEVMVMSLILFNQENKQKFKKIEE